MPLIDLTLPSVFVLLNNVTAMSENIPLIGGNLVISADHQATCTLTAQLVSQCISIWGLTRILIPGPEVIGGWDYYQTHKGREEIEKGVATVVVLKLLSSHFAAALNPDFFSRFAALSVAPLQDQSHMLKKEASIHALSATIVIVFKIKGFHVIFKTDRPSLLV